MSIDAAQLCRMSLGNENWCDLNVLPRSLVPLQLTLLPLLQLHLQMLLQIQHVRECSTWKDLLLLEDLGKTTEDEQGQTLLHAACQSRCLASQPTPCAMDCRVPTD